MPIDLVGLTGVTTPGLASTAMPTSGGDAIVESGSNSDGEWTRWAEGAQICYLKSAVSSAVSGQTPFGQDRTFPRPFVTASGLTLSTECHVNDTNDAIKVISWHRLLTATSVRVLGAKLQDGGSVYVNFSAFGRWK